MRRFAQVSPGRWSWHLDPPSTGSGEHQSGGLTRSHWRVATARRRIQTGSARRLPPAQVDESPTIRLSRLASRSVINVGRNGAPCSVGVLDGTAPHSA